MVLSKIQKKKKINKKVCVICSTTSFKGVFKNNNNDNNYD